MEGVLVWASRATRSEHDGPGADSRVGLVDDRGRALRIHRGALADRDIRAGAVDAERERDVANLDRDDRCPTPGGRDDVAPVPAHRDLVPAEDGGRYPRGVSEGRAVRIVRVPVSYTHLTLPTSDLV